MNQLSVSQAHAEVTRRLDAAASRRRARQVRPRPAGRHQFPTAWIRG